MGKMPKWWKWWTPTGNGGLEMVDTHEMVDGDEMVDEMVDTHNEMVDTEMVDTEMVDTH
jgi:hypothetical protein